jgi:hypothetical protein
LPAKFEPARVLHVLTPNGVQFIVIGGLAAYLQGSRLPTVDIDITRRAGIENLERLSQALTQLEARVRTKRTEPLPFDHNARSLGAVDMWNLSTKYGDLYRWRKRLARVTARHCPQ